MRRQRSGEFARHVAWQTKRLLSAIRRRLRPGYERLSGVDLRRVPHRRLEQRALLSYLVHPFSIAADDPRSYAHINIWHCVEMTRALNDLGFLVDVVDYRDVKFHPQVDYDLFIGHGGINFERIAAHLPPSTHKIYFSTGAYWRFHNRQESLRFETLYRRRGIQLPPDRPIVHSEEGALRMADGILGIGNRHTRATYSDFKRVEMIDGTAREDTQPDPAGRDFREARRNFLFIASHGNVHKGLDLVLEAFSDLSLNLWIMAPIEPDFRRAYRRELQRTPTIHCLGWTPPRSERFYQPMRACAWSILPSCSEGQAHSILDSMTQGLIPVVSRAVGVDIEDFGTLIEPVSVEAIRGLVTQLVELPAEVVGKRAARARQSAQTRYNENAFRSNFTGALLRLLDRRPEGQGEATGQE